MAGMQLVVGAPLQPFVIESVDPQRMKTMVAILRDPNPIHYNAEVTRKLGLGDRPVNQGPINLTWMIESVARFVGGPERLLNIKVRFLGNVLAGERFECSGQVRSVDATAGTAEIEVNATADGRPVLGGTATVALAE